MPREKPRAIGRDHWIEILRSTGVQTGQSRLHYVKEFEEIADARMPYGFASCRFQFMLRRADARLVARPAFQVSKKRGADRDRTDDLKLAKLALSQLSYGPIRKTESRNQVSEKLSQYRCSALCALSGGPGTS